MTFFTKINCLRVLLSGVFMLVVFNVVLNYIENKYENDVSLNRLSMRQVRKYAKRLNHSSSVVVNNASSTLYKEHSVKNTSVISSNSSIPIQNQSIPQTQLLEQFSNSNFTTDINVTQIIVNNYTESTPILSKCAALDLEDAGPITPNITLESLDVVEATLGPLLEAGGAFSPTDCLPKDHVAIVVPFRDRYAHLSIFLRNIHPFLMKQHIAYRIFIVEQTNGQAFNRAALMNIGYLEALKLYPWDCFIFHDVDLLPLDDRNLYTCPRQPRHMSVAIDVLNFKLPYSTIFGGVSAMTRKHFKAVNGFSNLYFGWGGEDDDMSNRLKHAGLYIGRYPINIARYMMLKHRKEKANPKRFENLVNGINKMEIDGLNSIKYEIFSFKEFPTFTWYLAELKILEQKN